VSDSRLNSTGIPIPAKNDVDYHWIEGMQVMIYWYNNRLFANSAICPHMGAELELHDGCVRCPWHGIFADPENLKIHGGGGILKLKVTNIIGFRLEVINQEIFLYKDS